MIDKHDGIAFVTKQEFDAEKARLQTQIDDLKRQIAELLRK